MILTYSYYKFISIFPIIILENMFDKPFDNTIKIDSKMNEKMNKLLEIYKSKLINILTKEIK